MKAVWNRCGALSACIAMLSANANAQNDAAPPLRKTPGIVVPYAPAPTGNPPDTATSTPIFPPDVTSYVPATTDDPKPPPASPTQNAAQRREAQRLAQERRVRDLMVGFGVIDAGVQDALLAHIGAQVRARTRVRQLGVELYQALRRPALANEEVRRLLNDYQVALEADGGERARAEEALNNRIGFRDQPRLEAMLMLFGIIGDNPVIMPFGLNRPPNRRTNEARSATNGAAANQSSNRVRSEQRARLSAPGGLEGNRPYIAQRPEGGAGQPETDADFAINNRVLTDEQADEEGETIVGTIIGQRDEGIEVRLDNGTTRRFLPRVTGDPDAPDGGVDGEMLRILATLEIGQRVRLRWIDDDRPRILSIEKLDADEAP